ncbi:MAG: hypothetical protein HY737_05615 [Candidatus Omnitrophica bacterium]|nr:hypothetical protein [Candidatus Omnitrophota bacterium]
MDTREGHTGIDVEQANLELRLAEQSFFRGVVAGVRGRYRRLLMWTLVAATGVMLVWTFLACPALHHRIGWCPMGHIAQQPTR